MVGVQSGPDLLFRVGVQSGPDLLFMVRVQSVVGVQSVPDQTTYGWSSIPSMLVPTLGRTISNLVARTATTTTTATATAFPIASMVA